MFSALRHRNFRLYLSGQFISLVGTWMQQLAVSWLVYRLTHSAFLLGVATFSSQIPTFFFGLFAGVFVDRVNRHRLLMWTQALSALQALSLALLTLYGRINFAEILFLSTLLGIINAIDMPTRQAFVVQLVDDKRDLPNAIALNSSVMNGTRLIGPAIAGFFIATFGEGLCFLINALSYVAVLGALSSMTVKPTDLQKNFEPIVKSLRTGMRFAFGSSAIGSLLVLLSILSLLGAPFITLFPAMADRVFQGGAHTLGIISAATGLGAFSAAILLASRRSVLGFGRLIGVSAFVFGLSLFSLSFATRLVLAIPLLFFAGFGMMIQMASSNMVIQTMVDDDKRGRIMSLFTLSLMGFAPFGSLLVGGLAERFGILPTFQVCGGIFLLVSIWFLNQLPRIGREVEPIYSKLGIWTVDAFTHDGKKPFIF